MEKKSTKTQRNILIAFILNLSFSIFEFFGGFFTNSVAILSDSIHDLGDAISIGIAYFLEKKSNKKADLKYTYGYRRFSVLGSLITIVILLVGSILVIITSIKRLINPQPVNYEGMIIFAIIGVVINLVAAFITREGDSLNQKSVNLHMFEDVLGWVVVLIGAIVMNFTDIKILDPILSICVALFIGFNALKGLKAVLDLFLAKVPNDIDVEEIKEHLEEIDGVYDVHHLHIWSMDGETHLATMHAIVEDDSVKAKIREEMKEHGISHTIIETEKQGDVCDDKECEIGSLEGVSHNHHHHHH